MKKTLERLLKITDGCRPDMHEPDEQGLSASVVGTVLDNAMGNRIDPFLIFNGAQEIVVILDRQTDEGRITEAFNLATLIALARMADATVQLVEDRVARMTAVEKAAPDILAALKALLKIIGDARADEGFDATTCDAGGIIFGDIASEAIEAAEAAIAKAEGRGDG